MAKQPRLGSGERFAKLEKSLAGKVENPGAVAAKIGREKYGAKKMKKLAKAGARRAAKAKK